MRTRPLFPYGPKRGQYTAPVRPKEAELSREGLDHYWHPDREGAEPCPEDFALLLREVSSDIAITRPPARAPLTRARAWLIWYRKPSITHPLSPGWMLLFDWRSPAGAPLPLDNRVLANLYMMSARVFESGRKYFEHCVEEMNRTKASRERTYQDDRKERQRDYFQSTKISNLGKGNKFALHHDGTLLPTRGHMAHYLEQRKSVIPSEMVREEAEQRERREAHRLGYTPGA